MQVAVWRRGWIHDTRHGLSDRTLSHLVKHSDKLIDRCLGENTVHALAAEAGVGRLVQAAGIDNTGFGQVFDQHLDEFDLIRGVGLVGQECRYTPCSSMFMLSPVIIGFLVDRCGPSVRAGFPSWVLSPKIDSRASVPPAATRRTELPPWHNVQPCRAGAGGASWRNRPAVAFRPRPATPELSPDARHSAIGATNPGPSA